MNSDIPKRIRNSFYSAIDQAFDGHNKSTIKESHGAVVVSRGKIMGGGYNTTNTSPFGWISGSSKFTHAEPAALLDHANRHMSSFRGRRVQYFEKRTTNSSENVGGRIHCSNSNFQKWRNRENMPLQTMFSVY